jgi:hypothetical protein
LSFQRLFFLFPAQLSLLQSRPAAAHARKHPGPRPAEGARSCRVFGGFSGLLEIKSAFFLCNSRLNHAESLGAQLRRCSVQRASVACTSGVACGSSGAPASRRGRRRQSGAAAQVPC